MARKNVQKIFLVFVLGVFITLTGWTQKKGNYIKIYPENPWYWEYQDSPVLLLGGSKKDNLFQIPGLKGHLEDMAACGGNYIRNTMGPWSPREPGGDRVYPFKKPGNGKYDLDQWNREYWKRFKRMLRLTHKMGIVVQIEVWDRFNYSRDSWKNNPWNPDDNVNYGYQESGFKAEYPRHPGTNEQPFFFTTPKQSNNTTVLPYQQKYVNKLLDYSLKYPNVLYCMDNETSGEEEWAVYWAGFIRKRAQKEGVPVNITEMWDSWDLKSDQHRRTFDHPERFDFVDISQNNHQVGETHWRNLQWVRNYLSDQPRPMDNVKIYGSEADSHGGSLQDAVEKFWRLILGGAASARFHRPISGIGLSETAQASLKSARMFLEDFPVFEAEPDAEHQLLSEREENEAYLSHIGNRQYAIYFPRGGEVGLDLSRAAGRFKLKWLNISESQWSGSENIEGGRVVSLTPPGEGNWIGVLTR